MLLGLFLACDPTPADSAAPIGVDSATDSGDSADTADSGDTASAFDETVDVVIIGAGPAGLAAAIEAAGTGATVVVLERAAEAGGAANLAGGLMLFSGSPEQVAEGVEDSPAKLREEWPAFTGGDVTDPWFTYFADNNVPEVHDWLAALGVTWKKPIYDASGGATDRVVETEGGGKKLVSALLDQIPGSTLRYGATAEELLVIEGRVAGVRWAGADGEHRLGADAVIVATGGFLHDLDRVRALFPDMNDADLTYASFAGADGAGLTMLEGLGATTQNLQAIGFYSHATLSPVGDRDEVVTTEIATIPWVNEAGERFADESGMNSFIVGRTRAVQPGGLAWIVGDQRLESIVFLVPGEEGSFTLADLETAGIATSADTLGGLAASLGVDTTALGTTVDTWNQAVAGTIADPFRDPETPAGSPVRDAPFYALPLAISAAKAFGGVDVDLNGRVLDSAGQPIPGVYAAGEVTGMLGGSIVGDYGFTGSLTAVVLGGRVAGKRAGEEAVER